MTYVVRDNSGSLFRNDRATTDKHPSHKGQATIGGVDYWVSGWVKEAGPNAKTPGARFFSLAFEPKQQQSAAQKDIPFGNDSPQQPRSAPAASPGGSGQGQARQAPPAASYAAEDDDIPF